MPLEASSRARLSGKDKIIITFDEVSLAHLSIAEHQKCHGSAFENMDSLMVKNYQIKCLNN